jgi:hypothetical protein
VFAVHRLLRNPEPIGDLLPRPAERSGRIDLLALKLLGEGTQRGNGPQADVRVRRCRLLQD